MRSCGLELSASEQRQSECYCEHGDDTAGL